MIEQTDRTFTPLSSPEAVKTGRIEKKDLRIQTKLKLADQPLLTLSPPDSEPKLERKKTQYSQFSKANAQYHKLFKELSNDEILRQSYTCALQKDILYQGRLFVSDNWICFHSKVFGRDTKIAIPVLTINHIKKTKTALLVPNALVITTISERLENAGSTPITSSENSFRGDCPPSLSLDLSADFSDLDGVVRQRRQEMDTSSSGSQTPDYEKSDFPPITENFLDVIKSGEMAVHADIHLQSTSTKQHNGPVKAANDSSQQEKSLYPLSLNTLLLVYLFLVCVLVMSSCYMAFKILALEQRLNSLGSLGDYSHENALFHRSQAASAEIYGELSTNLFKLEKVSELFGLTVELHNSKFEFPTKSLID
ncbi:GRAM domain-containing protein 3 isoform X3 [Silurus asotus]|uniref:GRAM domain-containing protein 3 isoform X3 n=1 Tax=Silurus asotus TaxID=30991 RepID=A0AAD5B8J8_SILAS|nr:GRAM domain-containing protein 3 isoform X3 [Silurus asotus]